MSDINLKIRNFGPIKEANIKVRKYNIFIGHTSSGKSIAAKLFTIFNELNKWNSKANTYEIFVGKLLQYNIAFKFHDDTIITYRDGSITCTVIRGHLYCTTKNSDLSNFIGINNTDELIAISKRIKEENNDVSDLAKQIVAIYEKGNTDFLNKLLQLFNLMSETEIPVYIPAERLLISMFSDNIFSLLNTGIDIPVCVKKFGNLYENARNLYKNAEKNAVIDILNIKISFSNSGDKVYVNDDTEIGLGQTSSGIQSIVPLWMVFNYFINSGSQFVVIEEPELNLFPSMQVKLINLLVQEMKQKVGKLVLTTHSPYVLSVIDNLILANEVRVNAKKGTKKIVESKIKELIPSMALIDFNDVSSYFFDSNGKVIEVRDEENKLVGGEYIDDASNESSRIFAELYNLKGEYGV